MGLIQPHALVADDFVQYLEIFRAGSVPKGLNIRLENLLLLYDDPLAINGVDHLLQEDLLFWQRTALTEVGLR
jgi:hypothetical protein